MKTIVDGLAVEYKDEGQGQTLLMLHGWGNDASYFDTLCKELSGFRFVRPDLPGFGTSDVPQGAWDVHRYAQFVADFCRKLGIGPDYIVGHSFGGRITIKALSSGLLHPKKVILIGSAGVAERKNTRAVLSAAVAKIGKVLLYPFPSAYTKARRFLYTTTGSDYLSTAALADTFLLVVRENLSEDAAKVGVPTLLIWGKDDSSTLLSEGQKLHRLIKGSTLQTLDGSHFIYQEQPQEVARLIQAYV